MTAPSGSGHIMVTIAAPASATQGSIEVVDITGRVVHSGSVTLVGGRYVGEIALRVPYGIYFARVGVGGRNDVVKFLVE